MSIDKTEAQPVAFLPVQDEAPDDIPKKCPTCESPQPHLHPSMQPDGGEVQPCGDPWHKTTPTNWSLVSAPRPVVQDEAPKARLALADDIIAQVRRRHSDGELPTKGSTTVYADSQMVLAALGASRPSPADEIELSKARHRETSDKLQRAVRRETAALDRIAELEAELKAGPSPADPSIEKLREMAGPSVDAMMTLFRLANVELTYTDSWRHELREMLTSYGEMLFQQFRSRPSPADRQEMACPREVMRHADDSAAYLSVPCACGKCPRPSPTQEDQP